MAVTLGKVNLNLLGPENWTIGTGSISAANGYVSFDANGDAAEQNRYTGIDPWGSSAIVWQTVPSGNGLADGGWNTGVLAIDNTKTYRFSVWARRTSSTTGGTFYFGTQSSTGAVYGRLAAAADSNPYWTYPNISLLTQNQWYLVVGHVYPVGSTGGGHPDSGYYTRNAGCVSRFTGSYAGSIPNDASWQAGTTTTYHRCYHYYCSDATSRLEFYGPRIDLCDGSEPSIKRLLESPLTNSAHGIVFADLTSTSKKVTDSGQLISITTITSTQNYTVPSNAKSLHIQLVGGGGGSAGYCESGGGGGYSEGNYLVTGGSTFSVTVGGGGGGVGYYGTGGRGGTTSFGALLTATGGHGANAQNAHGGGVGGLGSGGQINIYGGSGTGHANNGSHNQNARGGGSYYGSGPGQARTTAALNYSGALGSGATGGRTIDGLTGSTAPGGMCIIYAYT